MIERYRGIESHEYLTQLRAAISFLQQIPDQIYFHLDTSEFYLPENRIAEGRSSLEKELGQYIMTYRRSIFNLSIPVERHLCANIKGADLLPEQLGLLQEYEESFTESGVSFVAYQNPLELISPATSALQEFYDYDKYYRINVKGIVVN
jgi:hypothetical protein